MDDVILMRGEGCQFHHGFREAGGSIANRYYSHSAPWLLAREKRINIGKKLGEGVGSNFR